MREIIKEKASLENLLQNEKLFGENKEKEKKMEEEINNLKEIIINLNNEIKNKEIKNKDEVNQMKQMMENIKIINEQMQETKLRMIQDFQENIFYGQFQNPSEEQPHKIPL